MKWSLWKAVRDNMEGSWIPNGCRPIAKIKQKTKLKTDRNNASIPSLIPTDINPMMISH